MITRRSVYLYIIGKGGIITVRGKKKVAAEIAAGLHAHNHEREVHRALEDLSRTKLIRWNKQQVVVTGDHDLDNIPDDEINYDYSRLATSLSDPVVPAAPAVASVDEYAEAPEPSASPGPEPPKPRPPSDRHRRRRGRGRVSGASYEEFWREQRARDRTDATTLTHQLEDRNREVAALHRVNTALRHDLEAKDERIDALEAKEATLRAQVEALTVETQRLARKNEELLALRYQDRHELQQTKAQAAADREHAKDTAADNQRLRRELDDALAGLPIQPLRDRITELEDDNARLQEQNQGFTIRLTRAQQALAEQTAFADESGRDCRRLEEEIIALRRQSQPKIETMRTLEQLLNGRGQRLLEFHPLSCGHAIAVTVSEGHGPRTLNPNSLVRYCNPIKIEEVNVGGNLLVSGPLIGSEPPLPRRDRRRRGKR